MAQKHDKATEYARRISMKICEVFEDPESEYYISKDEILEGDNITDFFHALGNIAPYSIYLTLTGNEHDQISFNHLCNRLLVQQMLNNNIKPS